MEKIIILATPILMSIVVFFLKKFYEAVMDNQKQIAQMSEKIAILEERLNAAKEKVLIVEQTTNRILINFIEK